MSKYIAHATIETPEGKIARGDPVTATRFSGQELEDLLACGALSEDPLPDDEPATPAPEGTTDVVSGDHGAGEDQRA